MRATTPLVTVFWLSSLGVTSARPTEAPPPSTSASTPQSQPQPPSEAQTPLTIAIAEEIPEIFALGCSSSSPGGGRLVMHWRQKDGSCVSSKDSATRALFRVDPEEKKPVFVREEAYREVFWREEGEKDGAAR